MNSFYRDTTRILCGSNLEPHNDIHLLKVYTRFYVEEADELCIFYIFIEIFLHIKNKIILGSLCQKHNYQIKNFFIQLLIIFSVQKIFTLIFFCKNLSLPKNIKLFELTEDPKLKLARLIKNLKLLINPDLKCLVNTDQKKLVNIKSYRGLRF